MATFTQATQGLLELVSARGPKPVDGLPAMEARARLRTRASWTTASWSVLTWIPLDDEAADVGGPCVSAVHAGE